MDLKVYREHTKVTRRFKEAELVLKNAKIINVFTNEIITGDIAIEDGMIVGIGNYEGKQEHDMTGKYVCPGFIDSHLHLESTLVTPKELVTVASRHGTTTFIVDPHECIRIGRYQLYSGSDGGCKCKCFCDDAFVCSGNFNR